MSSEAYIIRINRSQYVERDRSIAILRLDQCQHYIGQPVQVRYYSNPEQTEIDTVVAIGIQNGIGKDCYKVLSLGGLVLVRNVVLDPPDVSQLTHGEIYLCPDEDERNGLRPSGEKGREAGVKRNSGCSGIRRKDP